MFFDEDNVWTNSLQSSIYMARLTVEWRHRPGHRIPAVKKGWCRTSALRCCIWPKAGECCWDKRLETCIWASAADILGSCARRQIRRLRHTECPRTGHFQTPRIFGCFQSLEFQVSSKTLNSSSMQVSPDLRFCCQLGHEHLTTHRSDNRQRRLQALRLWECSALG